jgi:hypothetical protein
MKTKQKNMNFATCLNIEADKGQLIRYARKYLLSKTASTIRRVKDLIVEDREVKCKPQPYWVGRSQFRKSNILQQTKHKQNEHRNNSCTYKPQQQ